jgi:membrane protein
MLKAERVASARPPQGGAELCAEEDRQFAARTRQLTHAMLDGFKQHDLLTSASAISFQILTAVIPFALSLLALAGLFHLDSIWGDHLEPHVKANVSPAMFSVISSGVHKVFTGRRALWATAGGLLAVWQVSGAVRAVMGALARIYGSSAERRSFLRRYAISFALSIEVGAIFILVAVCLLFAPFFSPAHPGAAFDTFAFVVRWILALALLLLAVALLVRHAPATHQTTPWVSLGAAIVIGSWVIASLLFYLYLTEIASYKSVFGSLSAIIVAMAYLYISSTVFLFGAQLDAILRAQATGTLSGVAPEA